MKISKKFENLIMPLNITAFVKLKFFFFWNSVIFRAEFSSSDVVKMKLIIFILMGVIKKPSDCTSAKNTACEKKSFHLFFHYSYNLSLVISFNINWFLFVFWISINFKSMKWGKKLPLNWISTRWATFK